MPLMTWNNSYSVGIASIDTQHQRLMTMLNDLFDGMQGGKSREILGKVLDNLIAYTMEHFRYEENLFAKTGYPDTTAHSKEHEDLAKKVIDIQERYKASQTGALSLEVVNFLKGWLTNHIQGTDMKYAAHFKAKGVG